MTITYKFSENLKFKSFLCFSKDSVGKQLQICFCFKPLFKLNKNTKTTTKLNYLKLNLINLIPAVEKDVKAFKKCGSFKPERYLKNYLIINAHLIPHGEIKSNKKHYRS